MKLGLDGTLEVWVTSRCVCQPMKGEIRITLLMFSKARAFEKFENIVVSNNERDFKLDSSRLAHCSIDGPAVTLAYMADDKTYVGSGVLYQLTF